MSRHKTSANYDMPTVALRQNADIPQQRRRRNTNVGATSAADRDDANQCRRWANVAMLAGSVCGINTLRPRQNGRHFADNIFRCISLNENIWISLNISLKLVPEVQIDYIPTLVQIMAWRRSGDKPLSGTLMVSLLMHICVTRPQWVKNVPY